MQMNALMTRLNMVSFYGEAVDQVGALFVTDNDGENIPHFRRKANVATLEELALLLLVMFHVFDSKKFVF